LRGNYSGLYRPEDLQFDPHQSADFDRKELYVNRYGPLPGDHRHFIKVFGAKQFELPSAAGAITLGGAFRAFSGDATNALGTFVNYIDNVYLIERGSGDRLPWTFSADLRLAYQVPIARGMKIALTVDVFNVFNFQTLSEIDQRYTASDVRGVQGGRLRDVTNADGTPFDAATQKNPNFGNATSYQAPRIFRFGVKGTF
jgi:hypothetical protein